jgi:signal peptidase I
MQVKGGSMYPFIKSGDRIELEPVKNGSFIKKGDIILFRKNNYFYVHRVIKKKGQNFITKGDFSFGSDGAILQKDVLAKAICIHRNGRRIYLDSRLNLAIGLAVANLRFFLQYLFLFFRKLENLVMRLLFLCQGIKIYRKVMKRILKQEIIIRIAQPEDREELRDLYMVSAPDIDDGLMNKEALGFWLVAKRRKRLIGSVAIAQYDKEPGLWLINGLVVKPLFRGLGIGEELTKEALRKARESGMNQIGLFVKRKNRAALSLYKKLDFYINTDYPSEFNVARNELYLAYRLR